MARIKDPILFSAHFRIDQSLLDAAGLIDTFVNVDTLLFIDTVLLSKSGSKIIREDAYELFREHFYNFVRLVAISRDEGDVAWRGARNLLDLHEPPENGFGYGGSGRSGSSRPDEIRERIMRTASEIIEIGADDPEMISLMGFFEDDIGPDTISDFTTRVILRPLAALTEEFCNANGVPVQMTDASEDYALPIYVDQGGAERAIVLVPSDIVRELPVANDWFDIEAAVYQNMQIRARVNAMLGAIAHPTVADRKAALRQIALGSADDFEVFLATVKEHTPFYDRTLVALGYYRLKSPFAEGFGDLRSGKPYDIKKGPEEIVRLVHDTIDVFAHHVENGNLWEELWLGEKPKKERAAQLIYYAIADCYCRANDVDISPGSNMGGGPIDFKFSDGYRARVLVEMKRSSGTIRHGFERQLEIYKDASQTQHGVFVVMDFGDLGEKLAQIQAIQRERLETGAPASNIRVIDATKNVNGGAKSGHRAEQKSASLDVTGDSGTKTFLDRRCFSRTLSVTIVIPPVNPCSSRKRTWIRLTV